jgi:purine-nucleoside phosphorylase
MSIGDDRDVRTMSSSDLFARAEEAADAIRAASAEPPRVGVVLGSGLNELADRLPDGVSIPYERIPHFPRTTVAGHQGKVIAGRLHGMPVLMLQGRFHYYEGHDLQTVTFPVRVMQHLGVSTLILTAATGGIRADLRPGDLVALSDHLNLLGVNPLRGINDERLGTRFPDMTEVYSPRLREIAREEADRLGIAVAEGVYGCVSGPSYETPAEIRMLRTLGADVVGMSTAPEAIVARHAGMEVLGIALVSNAAAGVVGTPITHQEVLEAGRKAAPMLAALIEGVVARLAGACAATATTSPSETARARPP